MEDFAGSLKSIGKTYQSSMLYRMLEDAVYERFSWVHARITHAIEMEMSMTTCDAQLRIAQNRMFAHGLALFCVMSGAAEYCARYETQLDRGKCIWPHSQAHTRGKLHEFMVN